jgi:hypothetical protein
MDKVGRASRLPLSNVPADFMSVERWFCSRADTLSIIAAADFMSVERWFCSRAVTLSIIAAADFMSVERWFSFRLLTRHSDNVGEGVNGRRKVYGEKQRGSITAPPT